MSEFITYDMNLFKLLGMKHTKSYRFEDVKTLIYKKPLNARDFKVFFPNIKCCGCGKCSINQDRLLEYVETNLIYKPINISYYYYESNQTPVQITNMEFE
jgi:hypothetical protein